MIEAFPLSWPPGWPRTERPKRAQFKTTLGKARDELRHELKLLGARDIVTSTNAPLRKDGEFYASVTDNVGDNGVAVYFSLKGESRCIPCDKWDRLSSNIRAIGLTVSALRGIERWGAQEMMHAAFAGFAALPAGGEASDDAWWSVLGVEPDATSEEIKRAVFARSRETHPDHGGDPETFRRVRAAYDQVKRLGKV